MMERFEETASTSPEESQPPASPGAATGLPIVTPIGLARPGLFFAGLVLSAALTTPGALGPLYVAEAARRRRDDVPAESSTAAVEVDPILLAQTRELFEQGASQFFEDGIHSSFSRALLSMLARHGRAAFRAIAEYLFRGHGKPDVISEALRWLAEVKDVSTLPEHWAILRHSLQDKSARVRDGAVLGFAALDDPRARPLLLEARHMEQIAELRVLIDQVIARLERAK